MTRGKKRTGRFRTATRCRIVLFLLLGFLSSCEPQSPDTERGPRYADTPEETSLTYSFAVHPLYNPVEMVRIYQPLMDLLTREISGAKFQVEASRDYSQFEEKFRAWGPDFLLPNPWQTLEAIKSGYSVLAMAGEPKDFRGIFVVRKDSSLVVPRDLKGKSVSYPSPTALAGCILPQYFLHSHGVDVTHDLINRYVGSQESAIMNVYFGQTAAGATWLPPWRFFVREHPDEAAELKVIWETESLVNNSVMAGNHIPEELRNRVRNVLIHLDESPSGREILAGMETTRFLIADNGDYEVVSRFIQRFEREIRQVEKP